MGTPLPIWAQPKTLPVAMASGVGPHLPLLSSPTLSGGLTASWVWPPLLTIPSGVHLGAQGKGLSQNKSFALPGHLGAPARAV